MDSLVKNIELFEASGQSIEEIAYMRILLLTLAFVCVFKYTHKKGSLVRLLEAVSLWAESSSTVINTKLVFHLTVFSLEKIISSAVCACLFLTAFLKAEQSSSIHSNTQNTKRLVVNSIKLLNTQTANSV